MPTESQLRHDGVAGSGVTLPEVGLPRIVLGGKRIHFNTRHSAKPCTKPR
jgi:hypothetical protein